MFTIFIKQMYNKIINPKTNRKVKVTSRLGKQILTNYLKLLTGGAYTDKGLYSYLGLKDSNCEDIIKVCSSNKTAMSNCLLNYKELNTQRNYSNLYTSENPKMCSQARVPELARRRRFKTGSDRINFYLGLKKDCRKFYHNCKVKNISKKASKVASRASKNTTHSVSAADKAADDAYYNDLAAEYHDYGPSCGETGYQCADRMCEECNFANYGTSRAWRD